jgi:hypothetical protein
VLSLPPTVRVFVAVEPIDMRGSFDALAGAVRRLGLDPVDGHLYRFLNKRRRIATALWFDGSGWCVLAKRLEAAVSSCRRSMPRKTRRRSRRDVRVAARRDRLHRGAPRLVPTSSDRIRSVGDRRRSRVVISSRRDESEREDPSAKVRYDNRVLAELSG